VQTGNSAPQADEENVCEPKWTGGIGVEAGLFHSSLDEKAFETRPAARLTKEHPHPIRRKYV
jgi:hypothetical protein